MGLFPEIDLAQYGQRSASGLAERAAAVEGGLPPTADPSGVLPGLNEALIALLRNFDPGEYGVGAVDKLCTVTLPIPEWASWAYLHAGVTASVGAGVATDVVLYTVPADERAYLIHCAAVRLTGDNKLDKLEIVYPEGYYSDVDTLFLMWYGPAISATYWPEFSQSSSFFSAGPAGPLLLEPGTVVQFHTSGDGVAASTFDYQVMLRRTKLVRAQAP